MRCCAGRLPQEGQLAGVQVLSRSPGPKPQAELANVALDAKNAVVVRQAATTELIRHIQKHSLTLSREVVANLMALQASPDTDPNLRASLGLLVGTFRPDARTAGERLLRFQPANPPAPPLPPPLKDKGN